MNDKLAINKKPVSESYKYFMVFLCMLTQAIPYGIAQLIQPLFVHPLVNTFHFTLASYTLIFTFGAIVGSLVSPLVGKALPKVNFKIMYLIGIALSAGAYFIFGISTKLPGFYLAGIVCMVGSTFYSGQGVPWIINHWFPSKGRGVALGIAFCGGSIGEIFLQPLTQGILKKYMVGNAKTGYLTSMMPFFIFGIALLIVGLIIAAFIRIPRKSEILTPVVAKKTQASSTHEFQGWSSEQVLDTKLSLTQVGLIGSVFGMAGIIGNVSGGYLFDRLGIAKAMAYAGTMLVISILLMIFISVHPYGANMNYIAGMGYAITSGLSVFSYMSGPAFMTKSLFGAKAQGVNLGYVSLAYAIGFAVGAPLFGVIKGMFNFTVAWCFTVCFVSVGFILLIIASLRIKRLQKNLIADTSIK